MLLLATACNQDAAEQAAATATLPVVRFVYLVPSDRTPDDALPAALRDAVANLRVWYRSEMRNDKTFMTRTDPVEVARSSRTSRWFATHGTGARAQRYWENTIAEAGRLVGARFNDPSNIWILYVDAQTECGQAIGGTSGIAVLASRDVTGLLGRADQPYCPEESPDPGPMCRWVGGLGHELGHALGLDHPPGCDEGAAGCDGSALMAYGYAAYPQAHFTAADRAILDASPFLAGQTGCLPRPDCGRLGQPTEDGDVDCGQQAAAPETDESAALDPQDDPIPDAWVAAGCDPAWYGTSDGCDCACGVPDPDCADSTQQVFGCGDDQECCEGECCDVVVTQTCTCLDDCPFFDDCCDDCSER